MGADPNDFKTTWAYDDGDNLLSVTNARGNDISYTYDDAGRRQTMVTPDGTTDYDYDNADRLTLTADPRSGEEARTYEAGGELASLETPTGATTTYAYDNAGQLTTLVEPNGNGARRDRLRLHLDLRLRRRRQPHQRSPPRRRHGRQTAYDALDRPSDYTDGALNHTTSLAYDANDNITQRTDPLSHTRNYGYDKLDRLTTATDERSKTWTCPRLPRQRRAQESGHHPARGHKTSYSLDDDGRTSTMVEARGDAPGATPADYTWTYGYDENNNPTTVTDPLSNQTQYAYNALDQVTQVTNKTRPTMPTTTSTGSPASPRPPQAPAAPWQPATATTRPGNLASRTDPNGHQKPAGTTTSTAPHPAGHHPDRHLEPPTTTRTAGTQDQPRGRQPAEAAPARPATGTITTGYDRLNRPTGVDYSDATPDVARSYDLAGTAPTRSPTRPARSATASTTPTGSPTSPAPAAAQA